MSTEIQILEAPIGTSTMADVHAELLKQFPEFRVASIAEKGDKWEIELRRLAEFPLKGLGPDDDEEKEEKPAPAPAGDADDEMGDEDKPKKEPAEDGADAGEDKKNTPPFARDDDEGEHGDPIARIEHLLRDLQKVIPQLQHILKGDGDAGEGGPPHLDEGADPGPHFPSPHQPPAMPGVAPGAGPMRSRMPGGRPGNGVGGPPRGMLPTFTKFKTERLTRTADVSEEAARTELTQAYPNHMIEEFTLRGNEYVAKLTPKK